LDNNEKFIAYELQKKSGGTAAILNLIWPGSGYIYCGYFVIGIIILMIYAAFFWFAASSLDSSISMEGIIFIYTYVFTNIIPIEYSTFTVFILVADGFLAAGRYNRKLLQNM
jgi:hypothetical protein